MKRNDFRKSLRNAIREFKASVANLEKYEAETRRRHKGLNRGNGTYDPVEYWLTHIAIHSGLLRSKMDMTKYRGGADGKGKQFLTLHDGSMMKCYDGEPVSYADEQWENSGSRFRDPNRKG